MRRESWILVCLVLGGFVLGSMVAQYFPGSFLGYGQLFGLEEPVVLNMGIFVLTFGLKFDITIAGILGILIGFATYRFIR